MRRPLHAPLLLRIVVALSFLLLPAFTTPPADQASPNELIVPSSEGDASADGVVQAAAAPLRVSGPQYGMHLFIWDSPATSARDLQKVLDVGFTWQKTLFQWRLIEPEKGVYNWAEAERVVQRSNAVGVKVLARVDFQPAWARADGARNGPPDRYADFADFIYALADHFRRGSPFGTISAIELWNEPNLGRDWGDQVIGRASAAEYVRLLCVGHEAAKRANPDVVTVTAGLTPTGTLNAEAADDTVFLQWMYESGAQGCFDALGAHAAGFKAPPWIGPDELATNPTWGGHASFGFRRVEQLRDVMVRNGDAAKQMWLTEFGWSSDPIHPAYAWHRVTEEQKAQYVVEAFRWAYLNWQPWIGVMILWNIPAPDWPTSREEYWWAIANPDGSSRPAYDALMAARQAGYLPLGPAPADSTGGAPSPPAGAAVLTQTMPLPFPPAGLTPPEPLSAVLAPPPTTPGSPRAPDLPPGAVLPSEPPGQAAPPPVSGALGSRP